MKCFKVFISSFSFALMSLYLSQSAIAGQYLVVGSNGPGYKSAKEALHVLEAVILPGFKKIAKLKKGGKILAGGLPIGERAFTFIVNASNNHEVDTLIRSLPFWAALEWKVTPLQSFEGRAKHEKMVVKNLKASMK